jgi:hypothetical protein
VLRLGCVVAVLLALVPAGPPDPGEPYSVSGDTIGKVDIRVRSDDSSSVQGELPRRPSAKDAPEQLDEPCAVPTHSPQRYVPECLAGMGGAPPATSVIQVALEARGELVLPLPTPTLRPLVGLTGVPIWFWTSSAHWSPGGAPLTRRVQAGAVWATVSAAAVRLVWLPGEDAKVVCRTPGTPLTSPAEGAEGSPDCGYTYRRAARYQTTVRITWAVTWLGSDGSRGALAPLVVSATFPYVVRAARGELVSP